jgi:hypothetical protein
MLLNACRMFQVCSILDIQVKSPLTSKYSVKGHPGDAWRRDGDLLGNRAESGAREASAQPTRSASTACQIQCIFCC